MPECNADLFWRGGPRSPLSPNRPIEFDGICLRRSPRAADPCLRLISAVDKKDATTRLAHPQVALSGNAGVVVIQQRNRPHLHSSSAIRPMPLSPALPRPLPNTAAVP